MILREKTAKQSLSIFYVLCLLLYLFFPNINHSIDAWAFAGQVKYGSELFLPHHLFYNAFQFALFRVFRMIFPHMDAMQFMTALNAVFAWLSLLIFGRIFSLLNVELSKKLALLGIAAFSYGFWRYAAENETYIIPVFFSLLGSLFFIRDRQKLGSGNALWSGFFAALACLFHQIHIFWWLGLFTGWMIYGQKRLNWAVYLAPALIIPISYVLVLILYLKLPFSIFNLQHFVLHDVYAGNAGFALEPKFLLLGAVNLIRTFIQVHGSVFFLLRHKPVFWLPALAAALLFLSALFQLLKSRKLQLSYKGIFLIHLLIFILQFAFAIYNAGNAEFMVMLPALLCIMLASVEGIQSRALFFLATGLMLWNFFLGIFPSGQFSWSADLKLATWIAKHPQQHVIVSEHALVSNYIYYNTGTEPLNILRSPAYYFERGLSLSPLRQKTDSLLMADKEVFTDYGGRPELYNRGSMLGFDQADSFFNAYIKEEAFRLNSFAGPHILYRLSHKKQ